MKKKFYIKERKMFYFPIPLEEGKELVDEYIDFVEKTNREIEWKQRSKERNERGLKKEEAIEEMFETIDFPRATLTPLARSRYGNNSINPEVRSSTYSIPKYRRIFADKLDVMMDYVVHRLITHRVEMPNSKAIVFNTDSTEMKELCNNDARRIMQFFCYKHIIKELPTIIAPPDKDGKYTRTKTKYEYIYSLSPQARFVPMFKYKFIPNKSYSYTPNENSSLSSQILQLKKQYSSCLSLLRVKDENAVEEILYSAPKRMSVLDFLSDEYSKDILRDYKNRNTMFVKIDNNYRINTILSRTPVEIKPLLNMKFEIDISNCHPLLFNYPLHLIVNQCVDIESRNIYKEEIIPSLTSYTNMFSQFLSNKIDINKLRKEMEEYYSLTSSGKFWDDCWQRTQSLGWTKADIKEAYFASVFYGKFTVIKNPAKIKDARQRLIYECASDFQKKFPNIWKVIVYIRKNLFSEDGERKWLSLYLMKVESSIIYYALDRLYSEGYKVLNIHDSIFVLDVPENENLTPEHVQDVITDSLATIGLSGNFKVTDENGNVKKNGDIVKG